MQGAPKKTSGRSYSQVRPVARHFVCYRGCIPGAILKWLKIEPPVKKFPVGIARDTESFTGLAVPVT